jgi:DNA segregation ATPase FtsK/SpoIIIE, S-DNA-T family
MSEPIRLELGADGVYTEPTPPHPPGHGTARRVLAGAASGARWTWYRIAVPVLAGLLGVLSRSAVRGLAHAYVTPRAGVAAAVTLASPAYLAGWLTLLDYPLAIGALSILIIGPVSVIMTAKRISDPLSIRPLVKSMQLRQRVRYGGFERAMRAPRLGGRDTEAPLTVAPTIIGPVHLTPYGVAMTVHTAVSGLTPEQLDERLRGVRERLYVRGSRVQPAQPGFARVELQHSDPLTHPLAVRDLPPPLPGRYGWVVVGLDEDGAGMEKELRLPLLVAGAQGAGKSTETRTITLQLIRYDIPFRLRVFDPKGGQEFGDLEPYAYAYERNPLRWPAFLGTTLGALSGRQRWLREHGIRELVQFTDENPLDILIIDELLPLGARRNDEVKFRDSDGREIKLKAQDAFELFLSQGRSAGFTCIALTQAAQKAVIGPAVMDLFANRTCLRVASDDQVNVVMNSASAAKLWPAHRLPADRAHAGIGYGYAGARGVVKYRAAMPDAREIAELHRGLRAMTDRARSARAQGEE